MSHDTDYWTRYQPFPTREKIVNDTSISEKQRAAYLAAYDDDERMRDLKLDADEAMDAERAETEEEYA